MNNSLKTLITNLNGTCRQAAERAANLCLARGHFEVELEHLFLAVLEQPQSDVTLILRRGGLSQETLQSDLERELSTLRNGNSRTPVFSAHLPTLLESAWLIASLEAQDASIRSGHLLLAVLTQPVLAQLASRVSAVFCKVRTEDLKQHFDRFTEGSQECVPKQFDCPIVISAVGNSQTRP